MTREEARKAAEVMLAYANGEEIETLSSGEYVSCSIPGFNWAVKGVETYRIKPKPTYRPFKDRDECWNEMHKHPDFGWIKENATSEYRQLVRIYKCGEELIFNMAYNNSMDYSPKTMLRSYIFTDGAPFGIKEKNN